MLYLNGNRSHPIAMVDDRRVRPYGMSEGEGAHYAPDGSEQMVLFKDNGAYVVSLDGKSVKDPKGNSTRMASLRHVSKKMQTHKIEQQQPESGSSRSTGNMRGRLGEHRGSLRKGSHRVPRGRHGRRLLRKVERHLAFHQQGRSIP